MHLLAVGDLDHSDAFFPVLDACAARYPLKDEWPRPETPILKLAFRHAPCLARVILRSQNDLIAAIHKCHASIKLK